MTPHTQDNLEASTTVPKDKRSRGNAELGREDRVWCDWPGYRTEAMRERIHGDRHVAASVLAVKERGQRSVHER
ncbi:hypothetical protein MHYP_G00156890 [Metynnis hypsauchen]